MDLETALNRTSNAHAFFTVAEDVLSMDVPILDEPCENPVLVGGHILRFCDEEYPIHPHELIKAGVDQALQDGTHLLGIPVINLHKRPYDSKGNQVISAFTCQTDHRIFIAPYNMVGLLLNEGSSCGFQLGRLAQEGYISETDVSQMLLVFSQENSSSLRIAQSIKHEVGHILTYRRIEKMGGKNRFIDSIDGIGYIDNLFYRINDLNKLLDSNEDLLFEIIAEDYVQSLPNNLWPYNPYTNGNDLINPDRKREGIRMVQKGLGLKGAGAVAGEPDYAELFRRPIATPPSGPVPRKLKKEIIKALKNGKSDPGKFI